jgi:hypothetical protein
LNVLIISKAPRARGLLPKHESMRDRKTNQQGLQDASKLPR